MTEPITLEQRTGSSSLRQIAEALLHLADKETGQAIDAGDRLTSDSAPTSSSNTSRAERPCLPHPEAIREIIRHRQLRNRFFPPHLFADPAWDMLLDLTAARAERKRVSVTSLCIASGVPSTTALRWIAQMVSEGVLVRVGDPDDRRRAFIELSRRSADAMALYFAHTGLEAHR